MMKLQKLDKRYDGHSRFTHRVEFYGRDAQPQHQWIKTRNWLWQQFGPSAELNLACVPYFETQPSWAWDAGKSAIYLKEHALAMFLLKWEAWQNETV